MTVILLQLLVIEWWINCTRTIRRCRGRVSLFVLTLTAMVSMSFLTLLPVLLGVAEARMAEGVPITSTVNTFIIIIISSSSSNSSSGSGGNNTSCWTCCYIYT